MKQFFTRPLFLVLAISTLLLVIIYLFSLFAPTPPIPSFSPLTGASFVPLNTPITLTFSTPLSNSARNKLIISTTPPISDAPRWNSSGDTVVLNPSTQLTKNTLYTITLTFRNKDLTSASFTTDPFDARDLQLQAVQQIADDKVFSAQVEKNLTRYPWLKYIPIITPSYNIFFNSPSSTFWITFTAPRTPELEAEAVAALKNIGVKEADLKYKTFQDPTSSTP